MKSVSISKASSLPQSSGVYMFMEKKTILYIGKASNIKSRIASHLRSPSPQGKTFLQKATSIKFQETSSDIEALLLESQLIKKYLPHFNVLWKDDKNYFFVAITKEKLPRVFITHRPGTNDTRVGPFVEGRSIKQVLRLLRRIFPYYARSARSRQAAKTHPKGKCPYCHLNLCPGPNPNPKEYQKNIAKLRGVLEGNGDRILSRIRKEMEKASSRQVYEEATVLRDQYRSLSRVMQHSSSFFLTNEEDWYVEAEQELRRLFETSRKISRLEAFDISNIHGKNATGSMVVFQDGAKTPSFYRKFRIGLKDTPDDTAMMQELVARRMAHIEWPFPDLMLIDGGKGQLSSARAAFTSQKKNLSGITMPLLVALAKGTNTLFFLSSQGVSDIPVKSLHPSLQRLLLHIRDEAHRFALSYHHALRKQEVVGRKERRGREESISSREGKQQILGLSKDER